MERRAVEALAGRRADLERLEVFALGDEPLVMYIQGIPGIGKTHLLNALTASFGGKDVFVERQTAAVGMFLCFFGLGVLALEVGECDVQRFVTELDW